MKISFKDHILPHLLAVVVFYILTIILFQPMIFDGQQMNQHDILMHTGGAQELVEYRDATGEEGLWSNSMFSGMPAYLVNLVWSRQALDFLHHVVSGGLPHPSGAIFISLLSAYLMLLCFGVRPFLALVGALGFGLSSYLLIGLGAGHNARIMAIAFGPMIIGALHLAFTRGSWLSYAFLALAMALHLRFNHLQITYYLILFLLPYGIIQIIHLVRSGERSHLIKRLLGIGAAAVLALLTFIGPFFTTLEYSKYSIRGASELTQVQEGSNFSKEGLSKTYAFEYSYGLGEAWTLLIPNYVGGSSSESFLSDPQSQTTRFLRSLSATNQQQAQQLSRFSIHYWGIQSGTAPYYGGAILVLLFVVGIAFAPRRYAIWLAAIALFGIMLAWGDSFKAFNYFMFDYFPGYDKFRSVTFAIYIPLLALCLLGGLGLEAVFARKWEGNSLRNLLYVIGGVGLFLLLLWIVGGFGSFQRAGDQSLPQGMQNALMSDRKGLFRADVLRSLLFVLAAGAVIWLALRNTLKQNLAALILAALVIFDMMGVNQRVFGENNFQRSLLRQYFQADVADQSIMSVAGPVDRVINLDVNVWADNRTSYFHKSIGGYHGAKMRRYQDLVDRHMGAEMQTMIGNLNARRSLGQGTPVLNMMNAKYIRFTSQGRPVAQENAQAMGPAWFVSDIKAVNSPDEEIAALGTENLLTTGVIDQSKFPNLPEGGAGTITIGEYFPGDVTYNLNVTDAGLAVFSEVYYPVGWKATLDGEPVDIYRVNYILRGVSVPAGQHTLRFEFEPRSYQLG
ncbi:MAG: YfhO family protein, partial [Bacteroidota bacterium]